MADTLSRRPSRQQDRFLHAEAVLGIPWAEIQRRDGEGGFTAEEDVHILASLGPTTDLGRRARRRLIARVLLAYHRSHPGAFVPTTRIATGVQALGWPVSPSAQHDHYYPPILTQLDRMRQDGDVALREAYRSRHQAWGGEDTMVSGHCGHYLGWRLTESGVAWAEQHAAVD